MQIPAVSLSSWGFLRGSHPAFLDHLPPLIDKPFVQDSLEPSNSSFPRAFVHGVPTYK